LRARNFTTSTARERGILLINKGKE